MAGQLSPTAATEVWEWTQLYDQTAAIQDLSFMLFTDSGQAEADPSGEIIVDDWPIEDRKK